MDLPDHAVVAIEAVALELGLSNCDIEVTTGTKKGENYVGVISKVVVSGTTAECDDQKLHLIAKLAPSNEIRREKFRVRDFFLREALIYEHFLPECTKLQDEKGIPTSERFLSDLKCYNIITEDHKETMIMEDINKRGYILFNRQVPLDYNHAKLVMEELGKFHAMSFALKDQKPEVFRKFSGLRDVVFQKLDMMEELLPYFNMFMEKALSTLNDGDAEAREKVKHFKENFGTIMFDGAGGENAEPYAVICHGDCWTNNMMFKYENNIPTSLHLLDWQLSRYGSVATDITYSIFCCTDKQLRDKHYEDFLKIYHKSFCNFLTTLGSDPEKLFPYAAFQQQIIKFSKFSFGMTIHDLPSCLSDSEDIMDLDLMAELVNEGVELDMENFEGLNEKTGAIYKQRMRDVIMDCVNLQYI